MMKLPYRLLWMCLGVCVWASAARAEAQQQPVAPASQPAPASPSTAPTPAQPTTPPPANPGVSTGGTDAPITPAPYTIRTNVPLVVLDVVVTDPKGKPVLGLPRSAFHVTEMTEPQNLLSFEEAGSRVPSQSVTVDSTADLDRLAPRAPVQIILLDEFNTRFEDMAFARYSLKKFLSKQPDKLSTPTMLVAVDLQHFTVLRDYTQNKADILKALDHHFSAYPWQVHNSAWISERYATAFLTLRRVAQAVIGHQGHKTMIWIGRGFPPFMMANAPVDAQRRLDTAVQECVNSLRDARVTLYTIDPAGVMIDPGKYGSAAAFNDPMGGNYQFAELARATGGTSIYGRNDVDAEIGTAIQDGASFYTLTYRPTNNSQDPHQFRKITVTVDQPGVKVLTRQGYYLQYGPGVVDPKNPSRRLMVDLIAADTSNMVYDGVPFTVTPAGEADVFMVKLASSGLVWSVQAGAEPRHADFILIASTFDKKGKELKRDARVYKIPVSEPVPPIGRLDRGLDITYHLNHDPKAVRARFTVRITASGRIGAVDVPLKQ